MSETGALSVAYPGLKGECGCLEAEFCRGRFSGGGTVPPCDGPGFGEIDTKLLSTNGLEK
jgi:hypothetical protein